MIVERKERERVVLKPTSEKYGQKDQKQQPRKQLSTAHKIQMNVGGSEFLIF